MNRIRTALDDLEEEERADMQEEKEEKVDLYIDNQLPPARSSKSLNQSQSNPSGTPKQALTQVELNKRKVKRSIRRLLLKFVNNICIESFFQLIE